MGANRSKAITITVSAVICAAVITLIILSFFTNVFLLYGNDRSWTEYRSAAEADDAFHYKTDQCVSFTEFVRIDKATGKITV